MVDVSTYLKRWSCWNYFFLLQKTGELMKTGCALATASEELCKTTFLLYWTIMQVTFPSKSVITATIVQWLLSAFHLTPVILCRHFVLLKTLWVHNTTGCVLLSYFILRFMGPWKLLSTLSVVCALKEVGIKKLRSTYWLKCLAKPVCKSLPRKREYPASDLQMLAI
jgi:hypothetical protein